VKTQEKQRNGGNELCFSLVLLLSGGDYSDDFVCKVIRQNFFI